MLNRDDIKILLDGCIFQASNGRPENAERVASQILFEFDARDAEIEQLKNQEPKR